MKKSLNFLLVLSVICFGLTLILNVCSITFNEFDFKITNGIIESVNDSKGTPGSGEYFLIFGTLGILADLGLAFVILFLILGIPFFINGGIMLLQGIARIFQIGIEKNWKNIFSKILTIISIIMQIFLCILFLFCLISNLNISKILLFLSFAINVVSVVLFIKEFIKISKTNKQEVLNQ